MEGLSTGDLDHNRQGGLGMNAGSGAGQIYTSMTIKVVTVSKLTLSQCLFLNMSLIECAQPLQGLQVVHQILSSIWKRHSSLQKCSCWASQKQTV